jgi:hypothetical protein
MGDQFHAQRLQHLLGQTFLFSVFRNRSSMARYSIQNMQLSLVYLQNIMGKGPKHQMPNHR